MPTVSLTEFADKLNELMPEIIRGFSRRQSDEFFKGKITFPQFFILDSLRRQHEYRMTDIAHFLDVTTAAATGIVDRLVKYGYVQRIFQPSDRRIIKIKLTAKGAELIQKINAQKRQMFIEIFGKISQQEREDYLRILMRIHQILNQQNQA
jgi:DNA-binding MarR family transcriptional regulator